MIIAENGKDVVMHGESLYDVVEWLNATPRRWRGNYSLTNSARSEWDLGVGLHGAMRLAHDGWSEGARDVETGDVEAAVTEMLKQDVLDYAGFLPDIGRYCAGEPRHMWQTKRRESPIVHLAVSLWTSGGTSAQTFIKFGRAMVALVDQLENSGRRVELDVVFPTGPNGWRVCAGWKVKRASDVLDPAAIAFSLAHPAALRRLGFAMLERAPLAADDSPGYGYQIEFNDFMKNTTDLEDAIFLPGVGVAHGVTEKQTNERLRNSLGQAGISLKLEGEV